MFCLFTRGFVMIFLKYSDKSVVSPQNNSQRHKKSAGNLIDQKAEVSWPISVVLCALDFCKLY